MRKAQIFSHYKEIVSNIWLCTWSLLKFLIYEENSIFFLSVFDGPAQNHPFRLKHYWSYYPLYLWHTHHNDSCTKHAPSPTIPKIRNKYSQERHCAAAVPIPSFMFLWAIYIFLPQVCLFCCRKIGGPNVGIYVDRSKTQECGNWDWGRAIPFLGLHKFKFLCSESSYSVWARGGRLEFSRNLFLLHNRSQRSVNRMLSTAWRSDQVAIFA